MAELTNIHQQQVQRWQRNGHEPIWQRGTVRLSDLRHDVPKNQPVLVLDKESGEYVPLMLACGRPLLCGEVLPERADLALDKEGRLLSQAEFEANYEKYLDSFSYPDGSDPNFEPVPNVVRFIKETPDPYGESRGMVEIGFDPHLEREFKPSARFGPNGETEEEWLRESQKNSGDIAAALKVLSENQAALTQFLLKQNGAQASAIMAPAEPAGVTAEEATAAAGDSTEEVAPCGKKIRKGYLAQHQRFCNSDDCGGTGENSHGPEAA